MFNSILVAFDNQAQSKKALDMAIEVAKKFEANIYLVTAISVPAASKHELLDYKIDDQVRKYIEEALKATAEEVEKEGVKVEPKVLYDLPGEAIVQYAKDKNVNLIVIGSNNRNALGRMFLGSVSNYVVHNAHSPVMVIKE
ncbi:MAG: putative universal stress protein [Pelotomaculum sp. PtaB.Bin104]|nr:MAG: putative universal stress protein [Pelotomaculum sp. PtaB.Bin104]